MMMITGYDKCCLIVWTQCSEEALAPFCFVEAGDDIVGWKMSVLVRSIYVVLLDHWIHKAHLH